MKVALICGSAGDGQCGVGDYGYALAQHLALDAEVHLYYDHHHGPVKPPFPELTTLHLHPVAGFSIASFGWLRGELIGAGHDIVHLQYPSKGFGASLGPVFLLKGLTGMQSRSRLVATLHEFTTAHPLRKMALLEVLAATDGLVLTNEAELEAVQRQYKGHEIDVIPVGDQLTTEAEIAAVWGASVPEPATHNGPTGRLPDSLFHFGLPAKGKGLLLLLEALRLVRDARPQATLVLGGSFLPGEQLTEEVLKEISRLDLAHAVHKVGHLPLSAIAEQAQRCLLGVFPFDEGYSSKRSSIATISRLELPLVVGAGSREEHPYYAPAQNSAAALAVLLLDLLSGRVQQEWEAQVARQQAWAQRFSFNTIASQHLEFYERLIKRGLTP